MVRCAICYHLYNLKNVKNTHGRVLRPAVTWEFPLLLSFFIRRFSIPYAFVFLSFFSSVLLYCTTFFLFLLFSSCYFTAGSYFTLIEHVYVKITIIFRYSNYNVMPTSASTTTVGYILNIHNMNNIDTDYLPWRLVETDDNSNMLTLKHSGLLKQMTILRCLHLNIVGCSE